MGSDAAQVGTPLLDGGWLRLFEQPLLGLSVAVKQLPGVACSLGLRVKANRVEKGRKTLHISPRTQQWTITWPLQWHTCDWMDWCRMYLAHMGLACMGMESDLRALLVSWIT